MLFDVLSLFPSYFTTPLEASILGRAIREGLLTVQLTDIRDYSTDQWKRVDDRPFGGGPGMVMTPEPVAKAIRSRRSENSHVIYLSPRGRPFNAQVAKRLATHKHLILLSGHYEGIDQRVLDSEVDEELSIGDYVLTNGCLAALVVIDATARFIPGVLGHEEAASQDSFEDGLLEGPQYTRPIEFEGVSVPEILRSGDHQKIAAWRHQERLKWTEKNRPDLL